MNTWFRYHVSAICLALAQFRRSPGHFFFNILVLSMTLALPFGGITLLDNIQSVTGQLYVSPEISLFLKQNTERADAQAMEQSIRQLLRKDNIAADIIFASRFVISSLSYSPLNTCIHCASLQLSPILFMICSIYSLLAMSMLVILIYPPPPFRLVTTYPLFTVNRVAST